MTDDLKQNDHCTTPRGRRPKQLSTWGAALLVATLVGGCAPQAQTAVTSSSAVTSSTTPAVSASSSTAKTTTATPKVTPTSSAAPTPAATSTTTTSGGAQTSPDPWPSTRPKATAAWNPTPAEAPVSTPFTVKGVVLVNRVHPLTSSYAPPWASGPNGLSPEFNAALKRMQADAKSRGLTLQVRSGYRSYSTQAASYANAKSQYDARTLDLYFAKPGMSEHQTGLAADLTDAAGHRGDAFLNTPEARYLAAHATDFGFIIRYPMGGTPITGYAWEPWHIRYVGPEVSSYFASHPGLTLEQYLGQA